MNRTTHQDYRKRIQRLLKRGKSHKEIAEILGWPTSAVHLELIPVVQLNEPPRSTRVMNLPSGLDAICPDWSKTLSGVYRIRRVSDGKTYVGASNDVYRRWADHKNKATWEREDHPLYNDFLRYGVHNFSFELLEELPPSELSRRERDWIDHLGTYENGYNRTAGGGSFSERKNKAAADEKYAWKVRADERRLAFWSELIDIMNAFYEPREVAEIMRISEPSVYRIKKGGLK